MSEKFKNNYTKLLYKKFKKFAPSIVTDKMEKYCLPKEFKLQPQQQFLENLIISNLTPLNFNNRGILLYHGIGSGKTCSAIRIAEQLKKKYKIIIVLPAALVENFQYELMSECTLNEYVTQYERKLLKSLLPTDNIYKNIIKQILFKIQKYYTIYSYHRFINDIKSHKIRNLNNSLLIIDEIQNMISQDGLFYTSLQNIINKSNITLKIILLTATPIFDKPIEIALILNLIKLNNFFDIKNFNENYITTKLVKNNIVYSIKNKEDFIDKIKYLISYYRGAPIHTYPHTIFNLIKCRMSEFQYKSYLTSQSSENKIIKGSFSSIDILHLSNNFFIGPRIISNIAFPNKSVSNKGFLSFTKKIVSSNNIKNYSIKFYKIYKNMKKSNGLLFMYSNFKDYGGIKSFVQFLIYNNWKDYKVHGIGKKRFAIWSGEGSYDYKKEIKTIFNKKENMYGDYIKLLIGSPSIKEGLSLLRVQQIHILEPYWNISRLLQIIGRGVRFCSHKDMNKNERTVHIFLYLASYPGVKTIDNYIWDIAQQKYKLTKEFENILQQSAFDCNIFYNSNTQGINKNTFKCNNY